MRVLPISRIIVLFLLALPGFVDAQQPAPAPLTSQHDSDADGLSDSLEQSLLNQFAPSFMIGQHDCSEVPSEFMPGSITPLVKAENSTIYGQVFLAHGSTKAHPIAEIHFYHLWRQDCGSHGHPLDTEHISALVRASGSDLSSATWHAAYWYAAAHENTVCDVSQIARASTLKAEDHGAKIWISPGKHASYLNETLCQRGCGADRCEKMEALLRSSIINLGEPGHPMNGSVFIASTSWPLAGKMQNTNFPADAIARVDRLPETDIAWFNPGRHPAQQIIAVSSSTEQALATSGRNTSDAISTAGDSTDAAVSDAGDSTGNALHKGLRKTAHALGTAARHTGDALHITKPSDKPE
jgi:hypothetical protein